MDEPVDTCYPVLLDINITVGWHDLVTTTQHINKTLFDSIGRPHLYLAIPTQNRRIRTVMLARRVLVEEMSPSSRSSIVVMYWNRRKSLKRRSSVSHGATSYRFPVEIKQ